MSEFSMDRVVEVLKAKGVPNAYVEQTGGGTATIFAGPTFEEPDYGTRYAAIAGPGAFGWGQRPSVGSTGDFCVGADDYGDGPCKYLHEMPGVPVSASEVEVFVAALIYDRVVEWGAEQMVERVTSEETEDALRELVTEVFPLPEDGNDAYFDLCGAVLKAAADKWAEQVTA